jgi:hypothetical protein
VAVSTLIKAKKKYLKCQLYHKRKKKYEQPSKTDIRDLSLEPIDFKDNHLTRKGERVAAIVVSVNSISISKNLKQ